ncbi:HAMP domain-containing protein [Pelagibius litoralis]|uniref:histidine kinase n=1 Tax=Pelagibius litoralis TaxID=374515 RepID=A0A967F065_9PROT|nr:ATP-binding protein [Pelagibius litoralis]NIA70698.1 HAMP domain-containing protein [Pelagibius litoralis]
MLDRALPAALDTERMAAQVLSVIAATPALIAARDNSLLDGEAARIRSVNEEFRVNLAQIRHLGVAEAPLSVIERDFNTLFANLERQVDLVRKRNRARGRLAVSAEQIKDSANRLIEALKPSIVEASAALLTKTDGIRQALSRPRVVRTETIETFEELVATDYYNVERLTQMRFLADNMVKYVDALILTGNLGRVVTIRQNLSIDLRGLARATLEVHNPLLRELIAQSLQGLSSGAHGAKNVFELQSELIGVDNQLARLSEDNRNIAQKLRADADLLISEVGALIGASSDEARRAVKFGRIVLAIIAVVAFGAAIYISWRYVLKDVVRRLGRLADITRDLAQGNISVIVDVTGTDELGEMADAVRVFKSNAADLRRSNVELEQFAYVASHDLKAPLRGISNLATWIEQDLADVMKDDTKQHLSLLQGRIDRMARLLDDLLQFSRVGREKVEPQPLDLNESLPELFTITADCDRFRLHIPAKLPRLVTAKAPLEQIFLNLLGNAIKHHDAEGGNIEIEFEDLGKVYQFLVRDDGPGIPREFHGKVFGMFQTLKSRDDVEGSGMGLAIVKKTVESIGCTVVLESSPETARGTSFRFTWPKHWRSAAIAAKAA